MSAVRGGSLAVEDGERYNMETMPELPDIETYLAALEPRTVGHTLEHIRIVNPFFLRSVDPPVSEVEGRRVERVRRVGKRIVFELEDDLFLVIHLMLAGRFHWKEGGVKLAPRGKDIAAFDFEHGSLTVTEAGTKKRASLHLTDGPEALSAFNRGGRDVLSVSIADFREVLTRRNHTLKRALTDPTLFDGIGNAYSDEILHRAGLSPLGMTQELSEKECERLFSASRDVLTEWTERLREEAGGEFPEGVTAFRTDMAVHGKFKKPCPVCGTPVQRIRYKSNETNYCPRCQTDGKVYADRALSKLLRKDWPKTIEEWEAM